MRTDADGRMPTDSKAVVARAIELSLKAFATIKFDRDRHWELAEAVDSLRQAAALIKSSSYPGKGS